MEFIISLNIKYKILLLVRNMRNKNLLSIEIMRNEKNKYNKI